MKKNIIILFLIFSSIILSSCEKELEVQKFYKTEPVQTGSIHTNISYSSYTQWISETLLSPKSWWKVVFLWKKKWERVNIWEKLAFLDGKEAYVWWNTSANVISSLYELQTSISQSYDAQISAKKETLKKAQESLLGVETWKENTLNVNSSEIQIYENKLQEAELNLEFYKKNLLETSNVLEWQKNQLYKNGENAITNAIILDTNIINFIDDFLWVTEKNKYKNDAFEDYLSVKNSQYLINAIQTFRTTYTTYLDYKTFYETYVENKNINEEQIIEWLKKWEILAWQLKELLKLTYEIIPYSIENPVLTQESLNTYAQTISNYGNSLESSLVNVSGTYTLWLKWTLENIDLLERNTQKDIMALNDQISLWEKQLDIAKDNLEKIKNVTIGNIDTINTQKEIWKIDISEISKNIQALEKEKEAKLQEINIQIHQSTGNKNLGEVQIENTEIISPFSGIITEKFTEIWTVIAWWTPIYKLVDDSKIKLKIHLNRSLIKNLHIWSELYVEIEGSTNSYTGSISNIPNTQDEMSKNTEVEIIINNINHEIMVWSTAKVFIWNNSQSGIIIPNKAIISHFMIPSIMTIHGNTAQLKNITILSQNDNFSLVEWIDIWETIITEGQENIWDQEQLY